MAYSPVPTHDSDTGSERTSTDHKEEHALSQSAIPSSRSRLNYLNFYVAVTTTLLCILLIADVSILHRSQLKCADNGHEIEKQFGRDGNYMSIDHRFDQYWAEDLAGGEDKVIELDDGKPMYDLDGESIGSPASISMCVQDTRCAHPDSLQSQIGFINFIASLRFAKRCKTRTMGST